MPAPLLLIDTDAATQAAADVVVIGAGIVGACAAYYYLARRGVKVALVEKGRIGAEQCVATERARDAQTRVRLYRLKKSLMRFLDASRDRSENGRSAKRMGCHAVDPGRSFRRAFPPKGHRGACVE